MFQKSILRTILAATLPLLFFTTFFVKKAAAQSVFERTTSLSFQQKTVFDMLKKLEDEFKIRICVEPERLPWYPLDEQFRERTLHEIFREILPKNGLNYVPFGDTMVLVCRTIDLNQQYLFQLKNQCLTGEIELPEFLQPLEISRKFGEPPARTATVRLSGRITDAETKEPLPGVRLAQVGVSKTEAKNLISNTLGNFEGNFPAGKIDFEINYPGFRQTKIRLEIWENAELEIALPPQPQVLAEAQIEGNRAARKTENVQTAVEVLPMSVVKELPALLGEADVVKSLSTLAGVSSAGDGAAGFNVRGGNLDQNLALMDGAPMFNTAHVMGFFSVFNPDLVRSATLFKGHVPARFDGRLSSVLDVQLRDGDFSEWKGTVGVGIVSGKLNLEGPLVRKKVSLLVGGRRSYSDWLLGFVPLAEGRGSSAWFFDGLAKVSVRLGERANFSVAAFQSRDFFRYGRQFGYAWRNSVASFSLRHPVGAKKVVVWEANFCKYLPEYFVPFGQNSFTLSNGLKNLAATGRLAWLPTEQHEIGAGVQYQRTTGLPEILMPRAESLVLPDFARKDRAESVAFFAEDEMKISSKLKVSLGLRAVAFRNFGEKTVWLYANGAPRTPTTVSDSIVYKQNQTAQQWSGVEPRLSASLQLAADRSVKFSYNRLRQYVHQISNLASPTPLDVWQVSNTHIRPQSGDNFDLGFVQNFRDKKWELASDLFFKMSRDVPVFKNLPDLLLNEHLETEILAGRGRGYGFELSLRQNRGEVTGWLTYTFSRSFVKAATVAGEQQVNFGKYFPSDFDQPHQVNFYLKYNFNPAVSVATNYTFRSGRPLTAPDRVYEIGGVVVPDFSLRNNERIPSYHRLDLALNIDQRKSRISRVKTALNLGIYNVLGRKNPFSVYFEKLRDTYPKAYALSVVGSAIPSGGVTISF